ncbi:MAG: ParA family protein, partial [Spirochaetia bacterium]|nr:ParA family protein [Spirochaetia bacterium]
MGKIIVFSNQKGGVGKTTTAVNLGAYIADMGKKVLLIDFDPQGNLSTFAGLDKDAPGIYEAIAGIKEIKEVIQKTPVENLYGIGSNVNLSGAAIELATVDNREKYLKITLDEIKEDYDYIFIDSPPSLGLLSLNCLVASDYIIIPMQCEYFAMEGLSLLIQTISSVQHSLNPGLKIGGILFTMYDSRIKLANEVVRNVTSYFGDKVFRT